MQEPEILTTVVWGAENIVRLFEANTPKGIIIHHTTSPNRAAQTGAQERQKAFDLARSIQRDHVHNRGWADTGQNFTVSRGGLLLEGRTRSLSTARRGFVARGAHAGADEGNRFYWGIEVEGNNEHSLQVTDGQWKALVELCAWLSFWGQTQSSNIQPHSNFIANICPGHLRDQLPRLRAEVRTRKLAILESQA